MNHRTRMDWLFFFCVLRRLKGLENIKIILKRSLRNVWGPGWAMQFALFIFLNRKWESDCFEMTKFVDYYKSTGNKVWILLFPEGTDFTANTKRKSDAFATQNNLQIYQNLLVPRYKGLLHLYDDMKERNMMDSIFDVTVAYDRPIENESELAFKGKFPSHINFYIDVIDNLNDVSLSEAWLYERWEMKESMLDRSLYNLIKNCQIKLSLKIFFI